MKQTTSINRMASLATPTVLTAKRFAALALISITLVACSEHAAFDHTDTDTISGAATVAASGSGEVSKSHTRAADDITNLALHYSAKGADLNTFSERLVTNTGSHTAIAFNTRLEGDDLYWQQTNESANLYLTANRASVDVKEADGTTPTAEPLWATYASNSTRPTPVLFGEMKCRLAKFTVVLTASKEIEADRLSVYVNAKPADVSSADITALEIPAGKTAENTMLIPASVLTNKTKDFRGSTLVAAQLLTDADNAITVWYDKNDNNTKDEGELSCIFPSKIEVTRVDGNKAFRFTANEHITLNVSFGAGASLSVVSVTVGAWAEGKGINLDGKEDVFTGSIDVFAEPQSAAYKAAIVCKKWVITDVSVSLEQGKGLREAFESLAETRRISIVMPNCTTAVDGWLFGNCTSLSSITLPAVTTIGERAFNGCTSLSSITLPKATTVGQSAFFNCTALTSVTFNTPITKWENVFYENQLTLTLAAAQNQMTKTDDYYYSATEDVFPFGVDNNTFCDITFGAIKSDVVSAKSNK